jgi:hypothetical protein
VGWPDGLLAIRSRQRDRTRRRASDFFKILDICSTLSLGSPPPLPSKRKESFKFEFLCNSSSSNGLDYKLCLYLFKNKFYISVVIRAQQIFEMRNSTITKRASFLFFFPFFLKKHLQQFEYLI